MHCIIFIETDAPRHYRHSKFGINSTLYLIRLQLISYCYIIRQFYIKKALTRRNDFHIHGKEFFLKLPYLYNNCSVYYKALRTPM